MIERSIFREEHDMWRETVRKFVEREIVPFHAQWEEDGIVPRELWLKAGQEGMLCCTVPEEYGGLGLDYLFDVVVFEELWRVGASGPGFLIHTDLVATYIMSFGTEEQKRHWLPRMAKGEVIGCFGLTEPDYGSNPSGMITRAKQQADGSWVINGAKMWITNGSTSQVAVIWAKTGDDTSDKSIRGFLVPTSTKGFSARDQKGKLSLRASDTSELVLADVHVPAEAILPKSSGIKSPLMCLTNARYGISWGVMGAALACYEEAQRYSKTRVMFNGPIGGTQIQQVRLADMLTEIVKGQLLALHVGRMKDLGTYTPVQVSILKRNNVNVATNIAREARRLLGGAGILAEYASMRHMANLESVYTYEGTHDVHSLIIGQAITGMNAF